MMRLTTPALLMTLTLLGACQQEAAPPAKPVEITVRSESQKQLSAANDLDRAIALKRAIMDSRASCRRVASTGFVGTYKNMDYWTATCIDQFDRPREWAIFVGADDSVQVRLCKDTAAVGLPACVAKPGTEGDSGMATEKRAG